MNDLESIVIVGTSAVAVAAFAQLLFKWIRSRDKHGYPKRPPYLSDELKSDEAKELDLMRRRLNELEVKVSRVESHQDREIYSPTDPRYEKAMDFVRMGVSSDELMHSCGLVRAEAELMIALYGGKSMSDSRER